MRRRKVKSSLFSPFSIRVPRMWGETSYSGALCRFSNLTMGHIWKTIKDINNISPRKIYCILFAISLSIT